MNRQSRILYLVFIDVLIYELSALIAWFIRVGFDSFESIINIVPYLLISSIFSLIVFIYMGLHKHHTRFFSSNDLLIIFMATGISTISSLFVLFTVSRFSDISRAIPAMHWAISFVLLSGAHFLERVFAAWKDSRATRHGENRNERQYALILGYNPMADICLRTIRLLHYKRIHVVGIIDEDPRMRGKRLHLREVLGQPVDLPMLIANFATQGIQLSRLILAVPRKELSKASRDVLRQLEKRNEIIIDDFHALMQAFPARQAAVEEVYRPDRIPLPKGLEEQIASRIARYAPLKRGVDIAGAVILLTFLLPLMMLAALAVLLSMGAPVIFWQERPGRNGRIFRLYKFRTMRPAMDADGNLLSDEERQTLVGKLLRRFRIDELPQLFNVLKGDMSFIGPRPMLPIPRFTPMDMPSWLKLRAMVRPGITGWAQVLGGQKLDKREKVILDIWYLKNMSLALDMLIIWKTFEIIILGERLDRDRINDCIGGVIKNY